MPSYLITGVSRGIGLAFLENISSNPSNTVIGLVRNVAETKAKITSWNRSNIHIIEGNLSNYESLKKAVDATTAITPSLDYLILNAALVPQWSALDPFSILGQDPTHLTSELNELFNTNVIGQIHLINLFIPLVLQGQAKKVIAISSGMADGDLTVKYGLYENGPYSISKVALNMAIIKLQAEWEKEGVLIMGVSPGIVDVGHQTNFTEEEGMKVMILGEKLKKYAPHFEGPTTPELAVKDILKVIDNASLEKGNGGAFLSHLGNKQWI